MLENADPLQDPPRPFLFASGSITTLKYEQALKGEVHSMAHKKTHFTAKEQLEFSNLYTQKSREHIQERILQGVG